MTIQEAKKLKWGTVVKPTRLANRNLKEYRVGIFVGLSRDKACVKVVPKGTSTPTQYHPSFWNARAEVRVS